MDKKKAIVIGAGPAGLTAAYELLKRTDIQPMILESSEYIGGISRTVNYRGNRIDIGGHRFFSKSDRVMEWWLNILPLEAGAEGAAIHYQGRSRTVGGGGEAGLGGGAASADPDKVMLVRPRLSRIYFLRKFFSYPVRLSLDTLRNLGFTRTVGILFSYVRARLFPRKPEASLEDFLINRFGKQLYELFFKDYTEKVWGVSCRQIPAEWGAQRIKGVSMGKAIAHAVKTLRSSGNESESDIRQKGTETSLIERFLYPKYGPGQLWEEVARQVEEGGGVILRNLAVKRIHVRGDRVTGVTAEDRTTGREERFDGDYIFSTMPVRDLIAGFEGDVPQRVREVAGGLQYRDFITVGVLLRKMTRPGLNDTWIYIQEKDVQVGRIQLFNNWSPYMVRDAATIWVGMEYFCDEGDALWKKTDEELRRQAVDELEKMELAHAGDVLDATVLRMEKTYPAYFGTYGDFDIVRAFLDRFDNLYPIGRNGMHKYNNSDHSMLTAMVAVDNICDGVRGKENLWSINTEQEYHEER